MEGIGWVSLLYSTYTVIYDWRNNFIRKTFCGKGDVVSVVIFWYVSLFCRGVILSNVCLEIMEKVWKFY